MKGKFPEIPKSGKVKNFQRNYLESEKFFSLSFRIFLELKGKNFQNLKVRDHRESKKNFNEITESEK